MNFFFDNNLPPGLAHGMRELSVNEQGVGSIIHLSDRFARDEKDVVWLAALRADSAPWYVISLDKFKKDHRAERHAIQQAGHTVYVLEPQWGSHSYWLKAGRLVEWWPLILQHARISSGGVYCVPWKHTSKSRFQAM